MAGRGPAPKPANTRARRNAPPSPERVLQITPTDQPDLPELMPNGEPWPAQTVQWWAWWSGSALANDFQDTDWSFMLDTAVLHGLYWSTGDPKVAGELRLREAKMGATPEDRARLRIQFAVADEAEEKVAKRKASKPAADSKKPDPRLSLVQ